MSLHVSSCRQLWRDPRGAVVPLFALMLFMLLGIVGVAIDFVRGFRVYTQISWALDAAALTTAKALRIQGASDPELLSIARQTFMSNVRDLATAEATYSEPTMLAERPTSRVSLSVVATLPTTIGRILGIDLFRIPVTSTASYRMQDLELALIPAVNASMEGIRIGILSEAAKELVAIVLDERAAGDANRIALAPYGSAVNASRYAERATGRRRADDCVTERRGRFAFSDDRPNHSPLGRRSDVCPSNAIVPLTSDRATLDDQLTRLMAGGERAGHLGIAWGWYLLSPNWIDIWPDASKPRAYGDVDALKSMVIVADGAFDRSYENENGNATRQTALLCDNIKASGIQIYVVMIDADVASPELARCSSSPSHYFETRNRSDVRAAFTAIARQLMYLRLTQ